MSEQVGEIVYVADIDTGKLKSKAKTVESTVDSLGDRTDKSASKGSAGFLKMGAAIGAIAGIASIAVSKGINLITSSIGAAVKRSDTLKNATRNFQNMGFSTEDTAKSMDGLKKSILGLPTPLDAAVRGMQLITSSTNDIGKSQKIFSALNNGILGFGGSTEMVENAVMQLSQAFSNGRIDAQSWNSMINSGLGPALNAIAKQMGITTGALKDGLSTGKISVKEFQDRLIDLNEKGGGGLASLQKIAKDSTSGIGTSFDNMQTAVVRGVTKVIDAIGPAKIAGLVAGFGSTVEGGLNKAADAISKLVKDASDDSTTFGQIMEGLKNQISGVNKQLDQTGESATNADAGINILTQALKTIAAVIGFTLYGAVQVLIGAFDFLVGLFNGGMQAINTFIDGLSEVIAFFLVQHDKMTTRLAEFLLWFPEAARKAWEKVKSIFGGIGTTIGTALGNAFSSVVNGIIGYLERRVNEIVTVLNGAIGLVDKITPGSLPRLSKVSLPRLAEGGIVKARPGGIIANIGEGGEDEAVIPLSKLDKMVQPQQSGNTYNITISAEGIYSRSRADEREIARNLLESVNEELRAKRLPQIGGGNLSGGLIQ